jgi:hypothetical protein
MVKVHFIDYGNDEIVSIDGNLLVIDEKFVNYPCMGILCCLSGIRPIIDMSNNSGKIEEIANFMYNEMPLKVLATFISRLADNSECYQVNLKVEKQEENDSKFSSFVSLAELLVEKNYAKKIEIINGKNKNSELPVKNDNASSSSKQNLIKIRRNLMEKATDYQKYDDQLEPPKFKRFAKSQLELIKKKSYDLLISHVETLCEFYVQLEEQAELRQLMASMQYFYEKKINLPQPLFTCNNACVYKDDDKNLWYRAQIIHLVDKDHCIIRLVDYGIGKYENTKEKKT